MKRRDLLTVAPAAVALGGCAQFARYFAKEQDKICLSVDEARAHWATIRTIYLKVRPHVLVACKASGRTALPAPLGGEGAKPMLSPEMCEKLKLLDGQMRHLGFEVDRALDNPGITPNWSNIFKALSVMGEIVSILL